MEDIFQIVSGKFGPVEVIRGGEAKAEVMRAPARVVLWGRVGGDGLEYLLYKGSSIDGWLAEDRVEEQDRRLFFYVKIHWVAQGWFGSSALLENFALLFSAFCGPLLARLALPAVGITLTFQLEEGEGGEEGLPFSLRACTRAAHVSAHIPLVRSSHIAVHGFLRGQGYLTGQPCKTSIQKGRKAIRKQPCPLPNTHGLFRVFFPFLGKRWKLNWLFLFCPGYVIFILLKQRKHGI